MVDSINLASHDARTKALAEKLTQMAKGNYMPLDHEEWVELRRQFDTVLVQSDRIKLIRLYKQGLEKIRDLCTFNPKRA